MPGSGPAWTRDEDAILRKLVGEKVPSAVIGERLGRSRSAVNVRAHKLRALRRRDPTDDEVERFERMRRRGLSVARCCRLIGWNYHRGLVQDRIAREAKEPAL